VEREWQLLRFIVIQRDRSMVWCFFDNAAAGAGVSFFAERAVAVPIFRIMGATIPT
jgi:hypothetical protein